MPIVPPAQSRLRSSFIYLANAVNDLRGNWLSLGLVIAPPVLAASLCLLPDAINLQFRLAHVFSTRAQNVAMVPVQTPYHPQPAPPEPFPSWMVTVLHILFLFITIGANLVILSSLRRMRAGRKEAGVWREAVEVYRQAIPLAGPFFLIALLQIAATVGGVVLLFIPDALMFLMGFVVVLIPGALAFVWLYFSQYALVLDSLRLWPALLRSRDLLRGQFFRVAMRVVVFFAVWSGYNSWTGIAFLVVSRLLGPIGFVTGKLWAAVFAIDLIAVAVAYVTIAFFFAAGVRLYQDLSALLAERTSSAPRSIEIPTAPLPEATA